MESCEKCGQLLSGEGDGNESICRNCKEKSQNNNDAVTDFLLVGDDTTFNDALILNSVHSNIQYQTANPEYQNAHHDFTTPELIDNVSVNDVFPATDVIDSQPMMSGPIDIDSGGADVVEGTEDCCTCCEGFGDCDCGCNCCEGCGDCDCDCGDCVIL